MNTRNAFSLIESLVVLSIFSIIAVMAVGTFRGERNGAEIQDATASVRNAFERARNEAATGKGNEKHGVHVEADRVVIFEGTSYVPGVGKEVLLPAAVSTDQASTTIVFNRISATPDASVTVIISHISGATSTVTVTNDGIISSH